MRPVTARLGQPTDRKPPFKFSALARVGFSDTDAQGIVYYGRYLPYFDLARVEYERHLGLLDLEVGERGVRHARLRPSSSRRRRASTTCSRCSCARSGSGGRA